MICVSDSGIRALNIWINTQFDVLVIYNLFLVV